MVVLANRNGFYYSLDRTSGKFIAGRPMRLPDSSPTVEGKLIYPSLGGGSNWYSSTFSPQTSLYYVNAKEEGAIYVKGAAEFKAGTFFNG